MVAGFSAIVGCRRLWSGQPVKWCALAVALLISLCRPSLHGANILWGKQALTLAKVVDPIVLALVVFLLITPLGLLLASPKYSCTPTRPGKGCERWMRSSYRRSST